MEFISRADAVIVGAEAILCDLADRLANPNPACQRREIAGLIGRLGLKSSDPTMMLTVCAMPSESYTAGSL